MKTAQLSGIMIFAIGAILLAFAYHASNAPVDQLSNTFTGHYTDRTMWYVVIGAATAIGGGLVAAFGVRE